MSIGFYLDKKSIYAVYRKQLNGKKINLKYFPGITVDDQKGWKKVHDKKLTNIKKAILDIEEELDISAIDNKKFTNLIESKLDPRKNKLQTSFIQYADNFILDARKEKGREFANSFRTVLNKLEGFRPNLTFETIDKRFYRQFKIWLEKQGFSANYIGSMVRDLKRILNRASEDEINKNNSYKEFNTITEEVYHIYLSEDEIKAIYELEFPDEIIIQLQKEDTGEGGGKEPFISAPNIKRQRKALERAKLLFVIGCWTGLRSENYLSIDPDIQVEVTDKEKGYLHAIANKNGPKLKIPLHKFVREIYLNGGFPEQLSQQKLNKQIKILGKLAGINNTVIYSRTEGGKRKEYSKLKYELITTHTARRSFASNMLLRGAQKQYIMAVTGHRTERSFNKYIGAVHQDRLSEKLGEFMWNKA